jgi:hypothetical protein
MIRRRMRRESGDVNNLLLVGWGRFLGSHLGDFMKKRTKKLTLAKETLRSLEVDLEKAVGGATDAEGCTGSGVVCSYSAPYYCPRMPASRADC